MKKFSKIIVAVLAVAMLSVSFVGCGLIEDTEKVEKVKIQKETMLTIGDGIEVSGAYYGWYFANAYEDASYMAQLTQQFASTPSDLAIGSDSEPISDSAAAPVADSSAQSSDDPVADSAADSAATSVMNSAADTTTPATPEPIEIDMANVKKQAIDEIVAVKMACAKAKEAGIALGDEDYVTINSKIDEYKAQSMYKMNNQGGNMSFSEYLLLMNTNAETLNQIFEEMFLANKYYATLVADEYVTVKHILVMYGNNTGVTKEEAELKANDIKAKLDEGADFEKLMDENSEDSKDESGKFRSYTFTKDSTDMQIPFRDAAFALADGEISAPINVESDYNGYHIIKKYPVTDNDVAKNIKQTDKLGDEKEKLVSGVKVKENKKISYYEKSYK